MNPPRGSAFLALVACVLVAGCSVAAAPSAAPAASASIATAPVDSAPPSPSLHPLPTESVTPTQPVVDAGPIPLDTYARVVANDLRVRSKPEVSDASKKLEPLLQDGKLVVVLEGPVQSSGYDWYRIQPVITEDHGTPDPSGWVASGMDGVPWIQPEKVDCPPLPTTLEEASDWGVGDGMLFKITCFGGQEITFPAKLTSPDATCPVEVPWTWDPAWLGTCEGAQTHLAPVKDDSTGYMFAPAWVPEIDLSMAPASDAPRSEWPVVEVTGQFDHPAAQDCRNRHNFDAPDSPEPDPERTILNCRMTFVVTSIGITGP